MSDFGARVTAPDNKQTTRSDFMTKFRSPIFIFGVATLCAVFASGCTDLKPVQAQLDDLKAQLSKIPPETASAESRAQGALSTAHSAAATAKAAQSTADSAKSTANKNQQAIEAINEKIDRMFKKSVSK
jgi:predicted ribosome quality control (RQC) complex YloA/Tae2 family protein